MFQIRWFRNLIRDDFVRPDSRLPSADRNKACSLDSGRIALHLDVSLALLCGHLLLLLQNCDTSYKYKS